ncbi:flotillin, partial [Streptomyces sp. DfronAA-171]
MSPVVLSVSGIVILVVLVALVVVTRYKVAGPSEAFIVTGRRGKSRTDPETGRVFTDNSGQKVVVGGGVFVVPFVQQRFTLELSSRHIPVAVRGAVTLRGVKANLEGVAIVKVGGTEDSIRAAAQRFLMQQGGIVGFTQEVLSGALRSIVGRMSVEDIIRDRAAFAGQVAEEAEASLSGQGLVLDAFQIQDITTEGSYLEDLGRPEAARAKQEADIAEAVARRASEQARLKAAEEIAIAERTFALKQAEIKAETDEAAARAAAAGPLAQAARNQKVLTEQEKVAERQAALTDRELDTQVRKPADAARYRAEQEAEAQRITLVKQAEADAQRARLDRYGGEGAPRGPRRRRTSGGRGGRGGDPGARRRRGRRDAQEGGRLRAVRGRGGAPDARGGAAAGRRQGVGAAERGRQAHRHLHGRRGAAAPRGREQRRAGARTAHLDDGCGPRRSCCARRRAAGALRPRRSRRAGRARR